MAAAIERVAVTGAAGFIGSALTRRLDFTDVDVVGHDLRPRPGQRGADIRRTEDSRAFHGADVVVHLAALAGVAPSLADPCGYRRTNVVGTANVLAAARAAGVKRVVVASSSSVYGECPTPAAEGRTPRPQSPYAETKLAAEDLCRMASDQGLEVVVVRPFTVYGPGQRPDMLLSRLLSGERLTLFPFVRDFTFVDEVVDGLVAAMTVPLVDEFEVFNLGSGRPVSAAQLLETLADVTGHRPVVAWGGARPGEPAVTWADPTKARDRLGLGEPVPLLEGLAAQAGKLTTGARA